MSNPNDTVDVAVAGAGIVGAASALWLQRRGYSVALIDGNSPGSGASFGNAGAIAGYGCIPVNSPKLIRNLPKLLLTSSAPLRIDWLYAAKNLPWMLSFLRECTPARVRHISTALAGLLPHTDAGLDPLIEAAGAEDLFVQNDFIYAWGSAETAAGAQHDMDVRRSHGVAFEALSSDDIRALEPGIIMTFHSGVRFNGGRHVRDPEALVLRLCEQLQRDGGRFIQANVSHVDPFTDDVAVHLSDGTAIRAGKVVIAAGAYSKTIAGSGAEDLPLGTERGYHVMFQDFGDIISRPVAWAEGAFYATPMANGLRLAGTVEIDALDAPPNPARTTALTKRAHAMFGDIGEPTSTWLGRRPTMPDSLPVIGPSHRSDRILFAFGHQHLGLTLGGITGRTIADLYEGRQPNFDISAFAATRFRGARR